MIADPCSDFIIRLKNAYQAGHRELNMPSTQLIHHIAKLMSKHALSVKLPKIALLLLLKNNLKLSSSILTVSRLYKTSNVSLALVVVSMLLLPISLGFPLPMLLLLFLLPLGSCPIGKQFPENLAVN